MRVLCEPVHAAAASLMEVAAHGLSGCLASGVIDFSVGD